MSWRAPGYEYYTIIGLLPQCNRTYKATDDGIGRNHYDKFVRNRADWKNQIKAKVCDGEDYEKWEKACFETQLWKQWATLVGSGRPGQAKAADARYVPFAYPKGPGWFDYNIPENQPKEPEPEEKS